MTHRAIALCLLLTACHRYTGKPAPNADAGRPVDAGAKTVALDTDGGHKFAAAAAGRQINIVAGSGISATAAENAQHQEEWTVTNTSPGGGGATSVSGTSGVSCSPTTGSVVCSNTDPASGVSVVAGTNISSVTHVGEAWTVNAATQSGSVASVTGAGTVSCSPTTGAVVCTGSGGGGSVSSVTGAGSTICSPTTGSVVCTTSNALSNGLTGGTSFPAHGVILGGSSAFQETGAGFAGQVLTSNGLSADPTFQAPVIPAMGTNFANSVGLTTGTVAVVTSVTLLTVAGHLDISGSLPELDANGSCPIGGEIVIYGLSLDSTVSFNLASSESVVVPDSTSLSKSVVGGALYAQPSVTAATHTIRLLATTNTTGVAPPCMGMAGFLRVLSTSL